MRTLRLAMNLWNTDKLEVLHIPAQGVMMVGTGSSQHEVRLMKQTCAGCAK